MARAAHLAWLAWFAVYYLGFLVLVATFWLALAAITGFCRWVTGRGQ